MKVIAGLGNPGEKYKYTRHNIGFMTTASLAEKYSIGGKLDNKFNSMIGKGEINGEAVMIVQPMTYMNLSGEALSKILNFYKIEPEKLLVVFDDLSLELGKIRFKANGSAGGHNGIKSIIKCIGNNQNFPRLKMGIGPQPPNLPSEAFVLQKFHQNDSDLLGKVVDTGVEAIEFFLKEDINTAQNKYNGINLV